MTRTIAIVPMRHTSERVPGKNYRLLAGKPLYHHVLDALLHAHRIDEVVIDTDSPTIAKDAARWFPSVLVVPRPEHLRDGHTAMNEVLLNTIDTVGGDVILQTHSTNPFLESATIDAALERFASERSAADSLFGVTRLQARVWDAHEQPLNHDLAKQERTQDMAPLYVENSCLFVFTPDVIRRFRSRIGEAPILFEVSPHESVDIDTEEEWELAEYLAVGRAARHGVVPQGERLVGM